MKHIGRFAIFVALLFIFVTPASAQCPTLPGDFTYAYGGGQFFIQGGIGALAVADFFTTGPTGVCLSTADSAMAWYPLPAAPVAAAYTGVFLFGGGWDELVVTDAGGGIHDIYPVIPLFSSGGIATYPSTGAIVCAKIQPVRGAQFKSLIWEDGNGGHITFGGTTNGAAAGCPGPGTALVALGAPPPLARTESTPPYQLAGFLTPSVFADTTLTNIHVEQTITGVPTLSDWMIGFLVLSLLSSAIWMLRRSRRETPANN